MKSASVQKTRLWIKATTVLDWVLSEIDDPRGQFFVRATSQPHDNAGDVI
jgi:hypothetical protein